MTALRLAVIGVGHLGKEHARILSGLPGVELTGVADVNMPQAEAVAQRCGTKAFSDYMELLSHVDAAVVAVPTSHHHAVTEAVLCRGIPTLVEKPFALTLEEADDLLALSQAKGTLLQVGHIERFNPAFEALLDRPLTPKYVSCERFGGYTGRSTDIGVVLDLMIHDIDLLLALTKSPVKHVEAFGVSVLGGHEDMAKARIVFENGCIADLSASRLAATPLRRMQVWGAEGFASVDFAGRHLTLVQISQSLRNHRAGFRPFQTTAIAALKQDLIGHHLQTLELDCNGSDALTGELQEFVRCVRDRKAPRVGGQEGRDAIALATNILEGIATHRWNGGQDGVMGPHAFPLSGAALFKPADEKPLAA